MTKRESEFQDGGSQTGYIYVSQPGYNIAVSMGFFKVHGLKKVFLYFVRA